MERRGGQKQGLGESSVRVGMDSVGADAMCV